MAVKKTEKKSVKKPEKKPEKKLEKKPEKKLEKKPEKKPEKPSEKKIDKNKKRLPKKELQHYRQKLLAERDRILRELGRITESINEASDETEAAKQSYSNHLADIGTDYMEKEKNYYYADQEGQYLKAIEAALERIESGDYGLCLECCDLISEKRLEAVPAAELCINCKDKKEKLERGR